MAAADPLYPVAPVVRLKVPLWSLKRQESYLRERVRMHRASEMLHEIGEPLPECSEEERWQRGNKWAIVKVGSKKAVRVYDNAEDADDDLKARKTGYHIEHRPGKSVRCDGNYCGVAEWCDQWAKMQEKDHAPTT
jgi:hypothetical protein